MVKLNTYNKTRLAQACLAVRNQVNYYNVVTGQNYKYNFGSYFKHNVQTLLEYEPDNEFTQETQQRLYNTIVNLNSLMKELKLR